MTVRALIPHSPVSIHQSTGCDAHHTTARQVQVDALRQELDTARALNAQLRAAEAAAIANLSTAHSQVAAAKRQHQQQQQPPPARLGGLPSTPASLGAAAAAFPHHQHRQQQQQPAVHDSAANRQPSPTPMPALVAQAVGSSGGGPRNAKASSTVAATAAAGGGGLPRTAAEPSKLSPEQLLQLEAQVFKLLDEGV